MDKIINGKYYAPEQIEQLYPEIAEVYIEAFSGPPWFEKSKCASSDSLSRCRGGFSPLSIGEQCGQCALRLSEPAYLKGELIDRFSKIAKEKKALWYIETSGDKLALCALAWVATIDKIAYEKYNDDKSMNDWMALEVGEEPMVWLDEVFADKRVRSTGNLRCFSAMVDGFCKKLNENTLAFRTITPQMVAAGVKANGTLRKRNEEVPDRRDFIYFKQGMQS